MLTPCFNLIKAKRTAKRTNCPVKRYVIDDSTRIYQTDQKTIEQLLPDNPLQLLSDSERQRADNCRRKEVQSHFIVGRAFVRIILSSYLNVAPETISLGSTRQGKPVLLHNNSLFFNLSGTGDQYALAISQSVDVGVDIEFHKPRKNLTGLAESVLCNSELTRFRQLPYEHQQDYFYRAWSLKEATLKADGRGITLPLHSIGFNTNSTVGTVKWNEALGNRNRWGWYYFKLKGVSLALATRTT